LTSLPAGFPLPVLVVQHMAPGFLPSMVRWLRPQCAVPIGLAASSARLEGPGIYVAPTGRHLTVRRGAIDLTDDAPVRGHRPSATRLFQAVGQEYGDRAVGVLLTGMGDDGAAGMRDLKSQGAVTIAQDEASSIVFGMPGAAIALGAADYVLPPAQIASTLIELAGQATRF
jgi:two-component system chemotaxis response regulator CheB